VSTYPATLTRGRQYAVACFSQVVEPEIHVTSFRTTELAEAKRFAAGIDWRLQPTVILLERSAA
jgi:hypothetical protein